jgi:hypothetical protein
MIKEIIPSIPPSRLKKEAGLQVFIPMLSTNMLGLA